jgi:hypothetical protein
MGGMLLLYLIMTPPSVVKGDAETISTYETLQTKSNQHIYKDEGSGTTYKQDIPTM